MRGNAASEEYPASSANDTHAPIIENLREEARVDLLKQHFHVVHDTVSAEDCAALVERRARGQGLASKPVKFKNDERSSSVRGYQRRQQVPLTVDDDLKAPLKSLFDALRLDVHDDMHGPMLLFNEAVDPQVWHRDFSTGARSRRGCSPAASSSRWRTTPRST